MMFYVNVIKLTALIYFKLLLHKFKSETSDIM